MKLSEFIDNEEVIATGRKGQKYGIKHPLFTGPKGTNGKSHRKNAAKKKAQYLRNQKTRADLYSRMQGSSGWQRDASEWHMAIKALSKGSA